MFLWRSIECFVLLIQEKVGRFVNKYRYHVTAVYLSRLFLEDFDLVFKKSLTLEQAICKSQTNGACLNEKMFQFPNYLNILGSFP